MKRPAEPVNEHNKHQKLDDNSHDKHQKLDKGRLPVTILCGFLGAGKTTLLKHILEIKHSDTQGGFRCAVIVNDVAELNIDKSLIDDTALVQSDDVIAMQNGCVCCTLKSDLLGQIIELAKKKIFDYMIIEASGVSEPSQIAKLFADCSEDHDHDKEHTTEDMLGELARLDTCVTVVDSAGFFSNVENIVQGPKDGSFPQLLAEQVEYANVIILNKTDLVEKAQLDKINEQVSILNPRATVLTSRNSSIDVMKVVDTGLYKAADFDKFHQQMDEVEEEELKPCCKDKAAKGESPCCLRKRTLDSGKSKVFLAPGKSERTRHASRFGITSFLYRARRPFHHKRFYKDFACKFFVLKEEAEEAEWYSSQKQSQKKDGNQADEKLEGDKEKEKQHIRNDASEENGATPQGDKGREEQQTKSDDADEMGEISRGDKEKAEQQRTSDVPEENGAIPPGDKGREEQHTKSDDADGNGKISQVDMDLGDWDWQQDFADKLASRTEKMGTLFRSKGFIWLANRNDFKGVFNHAGNLLKVEGGGLWSVLEAKAWEGTEKEMAELRKDWAEPWGDRRQDLVFIGKDLKHQAIQEMLDGCLLTDKEFALGHDGWKATMGDVPLQACVQNGLLWG